MIRKIDRYIYKELIPPFSYSLIVLTVIFLVNFLIRAMDRILGKGLSLLVIIEYIVLNLAWILALAIPMSVLVAVLLSYGRLAGDHEITAMRSGGISLPRIMLPAMAFAVVVGGFTLFFNTNILPDVNHRARLLGSDIYRKRPDLDIVPGYFIDDLPDYNLRVNEVTEEGLKGVVIFSKSDRREQISIFAERGRSSSEGNRIIFTLYNGEKHLLDLADMEEYQIEYFDSTRISMEVANMELKRRETSVRGDREMTPAMMYEKIAENEERVAKTRERMTFIHSTSPLFKGDTIRNVAALMDTVTKVTVPDGEGLALKERRWNRTVDKLNSQVRLLKSYERQVNKYLVEIHKKYAMPVACLVFVLIGAPLGIMTRKSSGTIGVAIAMFFLYWAMFIVGEELADRSRVNPIAAMWTPNVVMGVMGLWISYQVTRERRVFNLEWLKNLFKRDSEPEENNSEKQ